MFWFYFFFSLFLPLILFLIGRSWKKHPPKEINSFYGYRTTRSMASQEAWDFAHHYSGKVFFTCGAVLLLLSPLAVILGGSQITTVFMALMGLQLLCLAGTIPLTEAALRKNFEKDGTPKAKAHGK